MILQEHCRSGWTETRELFPFCYPDSFCIAAGEWNTSAPEFQEALEQPFCKLVEQGTVALAGPFSEDGDLKGVYIFTVGEQQTSKLLREEPMVKAVYLKPESHPWITGKGVLAPGQP